MDFSHLHCHSQYSLLDGASSIESMMKKAVADNMKAVAITDHGNMFGVFRFAAEAQKNKIKPIIGCEFYLARGSRFDKTKSAEQDEKNIYHQILLAKNETGYKNLCKLSSLAYIEGFYYKPRIDKDLIRQHREGLIATTCCIASEINQTILKKGEEEAEKLFKEWLDIFGEDYYVELQRHGIEEQNQCNEILIKWAKKYNVKMIASNDSHYVEMKDAEAHDILLCLQTGKDIDEKDRMRFDNNQFYFKTKSEMSKLFEDLPEALDNTLEIVSKIENLDLQKKILLPNYSLPSGFDSPDEYLRYVTYEGAKNKYNEITNEITERLDFELSVVKKMEFAGYFLIVYDFVDAAKKMGVAVGPGRGSAAGSVIAYCTGITNIDPLKYNLLFERFLNPERISMPDIDIDFDDVGRDKVIDYVVKKYGEKQVAQIITFGTMKSKLAIRDVARVLRLPLTEADKLAKMIPDGIDVTLEDAYKAVKELAAMRKNNDLTGKVLQFAETLEGCARHAGIHAAGIIIAPNDLMENIPVCKLKDSAMYVSQFDGKYIEQAGLLKMDFLGLKTLSIIKDALKNIEKTKGITIDIEKIPLDDKKTYELFQQGDSIAVFQFEKSHIPPILREMKPTSFEDLIALNALNRPGPLAYIPKYIARKHGREKISYPLPEMEEILKETYGITVYQEQVMLLSQKLAGFTKGDADGLRKAMAKKQKEILPKIKEKFISGATKNGHPIDKLEKIWTDWEAFGDYAFNKSHSTCYALLAFQTAYLKAHFPAEFMAAVLTHNMNSIEELNFFLNEAKHLGIKTLGPDVNESDENFTVNKKGEIRFALTGVKGVGDAAVEELLRERTKNGAYKSIFDLSKRVNLRSVNKKSLESLAIAGAFDGCGNLHRAQYFAVYLNEQITVIEKAIRYGNNSQTDSSANQSSLFGGMAMAKIEEPNVPNVSAWTLIEQAHKEKEVTGIYISGHPLDDYKLEMENFCNAKISQIKNNIDRQSSFAGIVTKSEERLDKRGNKFASFTIEDYTDSITLFLFKEDYLKFKHLLEVNQMVFVKGIYQLRFNSTDMYEFRVNNMCMLTEVRDKMAKGITLNMSLNEISENTINSLEKICKKHPGKYHLKLNVIDTEENYSVGMYPIQMKIDLSNEVLEMLNGISSMPCKLN